MPTQTDSQLSAEFPNLDNHYQLCSSPYGDFVQVPLEVLQSPGAEAFLSEAEAGYRDGRLHDCGHLAVNRASGKLVFLVTCRLDESTELTKETLAALSEQFGVSLAQYRMALSDDERYPLVATQLDRVEQFGLAYELTAALFAAA